MTRTMKREQAAPARRDERRHPIVPPSSGGAAAGLRAGLVMGLLLCAKTAADGSGFWLPMRAIAALWRGAPALLGGAPTIALGVGTHLVTAALLGGIFASLLGRGARPRAALGLGLAYGAVVWAVMTFAVVPAFDPVLARRLALMPVWWLSAHLAYGALLMRVPSYRRRGARELEPGVEPKTFY